MITCQSASASGIASLIARQSIWRLIMARMLRWIENWSFPLIYLRNLILFKLLCVKSNEWDSVSTKSYQKSVKCTRGVTLHFARLLGQIQLVLMRARQLMITSKTINILFSYTLNNIRRSSNLLISRGLCLLILSTS